MLTNQNAGFQHRPTVLLAVHARGFTYLWLLFLLAVGSAMLAAIGERASALVLRDRETELLFRGQAIASAIGRYWQATPGKDKALPTSLQDLLDDRRDVNAQGPVRHLRCLYPDPYTGLDDWVLLLDEAAGVVGVSGVHSRSSAFAFKTASLPLSKQRPNARVSDHVFAFTPGSNSNAQAPPETAPIEQKINATE